MEEKPRLSRLTAIITQLQSKRMLTATYLAEKHAVNIRTIYRDINTLKKSGIPIVTEEGRGYSLVDGYQLPPVHFSEDEANALILVEQLVAINKDQSLVESYASAITKIKSVLRYSQKEKADLLANRIYIHLNESREKTSGYLMKVQSAITNFQVLDIEYVSWKKERTKRVIEPFAVYSSKDNWLLVAFCRLRKDFRAFRMDFIEQLMTRNEHFSPHNLTFKQYFERYVKPNENP